MKDHRIPGPQGPVPYTCDNRGYRSNTSKGAAGAQAPASVFDSPLIQLPGASLWLEHVVEKETGDPCYWLMWYDHLGNPTIPLSGVFSKDDLSQMLRRLADFVP